MEEVLEYLFKYAEDRPLVLVLDEYPHLQKLIAGCDGVIQGLIDQYEGKSKLKIILCGSHMDIMRSLVEHAAPLYGRADWFCTSRLWITTRPPPISRHSPTKTMGSKTDLSIHGLRRCN